MAVAALVLGIIAIITVWVPFLGLILGLIGIILSAIARKNNPENKGMATGGLVMSIIAMVVGAIVTFVLCLPACVVYGLGL